MNKESFIEKNVLKITKILVDFVLVGGFLILLGLPYLTKIYLQFLNFYNKGAFIFLLIFLYVTGIICMLLVGEIRKLLKHFKNNTPFSLENVKSFKRISISCAVISVAYSIKILMLNSILTIIIFMIFVICALFSYILSQVFEQAYLVKEENDLTI